MKIVAVKEARHIKEYRLEIVFTNGKKKIVNFKEFFDTHNHPQYNKYKKADNFKRFKIENGNIIWGKNWDMIFPVYDLYQGKGN